jgi:putative nucleotidyltransferase with HDIG domain
MAESVDKYQLPALHEDEGPDPGPQRPTRLLSLTAMICGVLRNSRRFSWLDREVYNQTLVLQQVLADLAKEEPLRLRFTRQGLALPPEEMEELPRAVRQFHAMARRKSVRELVFHPELSVREVMGLLRLLQNKNNLVSLEERKSLPHVEVVHEIGQGSIELGEDEDAGRHVLGTGRGRHVRALLDEGEKGGDEVRGMVAQITQAIDTIARAKEKEEEGREVDSPLGFLADHLDRATEVTLILASLRAHDAYTYDHSINVGLLSIALARAIGWSGTDLQEFGMAALIHDVGKLYTPLEVLNKPGRFTPQEWVIMKRHPGDGADILREAGVGNELAPRIAIEHHTNPDGTGYPPLGYSELHPGSKIVKIADCYDAFTTIRPYRSQARPFEVLKMLRKQAGTQFDAELVEVFCEMMGVYPIGSVVKLASGPVGLVVQTNLDLKDRPVVRVLQDEKGRKSKGMTLIDLAESDGEGGFVDEVVECIDPVIRNIPVGRYL